MPTILTPSELRILRALEKTPLSEDDLEKVVGVMSDYDFKDALWQLSTQHYLITKMPTIISGCRSCGDLVKYAYRLTFAGRETVRKFATL